MPIPIIIGAAVGAVGAAKTVAAAGTAAKVGATALGVAAGATAGATSVAIDELARNIEPETEVLPEPGSVIITKLMAGGVVQLEWHSGIYIGENKIVELKGGPGEGKIREVTPKEFIRHKDFKGRGINLFVSCDKYGNPLSDKAIAKRAKKLIGKTKDYFLIIENCHQFSRGCITGNFDGTDGEIIETKKALERTIKKKLNNQISWCGWKTK